MMAIMWTIMSSVHYDDGHNVDNNDKYKLY